VVEHVYTTISRQDNIVIAKNDITGDSIQTKSLSDAYRDGWDRIFGEKKKREAVLDELANEAQKNGFYDNTKAKTEE